VSSTESESEIQRRADLCLILARLYGILAARRRSFDSELNLLCEVFEDAIQRYAGARGSCSRDNHLEPKEIVTDPHQPGLLIDESLEGVQDFPRKLHLYVLLAPRLEIGGRGNTGNVACIKGREFLTPHQVEAWMTVGVPMRFVVAHTAASGRSMDGRT
jgi:Glucodextranase, domain N